MAGDVELLTARQREVAELIADGFTDKAIQGKLGISEGTLRSHIESIVGRLKLDRNKNLRVQLTWLVIDSRYEADPHYHRPTPTPLT